MLRFRPYDEYETHAEGGVRHLFRLGQYEFRDTIDPDEHYHHYILEVSEGADDPPVYEVDHDTMYEFMARFLAGTYELEEYDLEQSPSHNAMLDVLEIATARARAGETEFSWEDFDRPENEVMDDDEDDGRENETER